VASVVVAIAGKASTMSQKVAPSQENDTTPSNNNKTTTAHPWDVAVVYISLDRNNCGHSLPWNRFEDIPQSCPLCQANISVICDALVKKENPTNNKSVLFKYNKQTFLLSLNEPKRKWWDRSPCTAQERMAYALGMSEKCGIKVSLLTCVQLRYCAQGHNRAFAHTLHPLRRSCARARCSIPMPVTHPLKSPNSYWIFHTMT